MSQDKELEIRRQFLDEAQEYLDTLDAALMEISINRVDIQKINAALRAAHSIKGGAGMMGFQLLSHLAHRLEDSLKVLKTQKQSIEINAELENWLLRAVDCLRYVIVCDRQNTSVGEQWLEREANPIFDLLHERLGDPQSEDAASVLSPEDGSDIAPMLFETEVEGCLQRLEDVLANPNQPCLQEEVSILAQELGGLGDMLQLPAFSSLCGSVLQALEEYSDNVTAIAQLALQSWRQSQALVITGQRDLLPVAIDPVAAGISASFSVKEILLDDVEPILTDVSPDLAVDPVLDDAELDDAELDDTVLDASILNAPILDSSALDNIDAILASLSPNPVSEVSLDEALADHFDDWLATTQLLEELEPDSLHGTEPTADRFDNQLSTTQPFIQAELTPTIIPSQPPVQPPSPPKQVSAEQVQSESIQPIARRKKPVSESKVTDFKVLEVKPDSTHAPVEEDQDATVRVPVRQLNQLNDLFGELTIERNGLDLYIKRLRSLMLTLNRRIRILEQSNAQMRTAYDKTALKINPTVPLLPGTPGQPNSRLASYTSMAASNSDVAQNLHQFDALEMDRYNDLHLMSQEVMETIVQVQEVASDIDLSLEDAEQTTRELNKTAKQLQTNLTQLRMRPLSDVVDRFPRALRELSLQYGKKVKLNIVGGGTLIDRNILEYLNDPLMHLLRNAFDHGIEDPETRKACGKSEEGFIEIRAVHRGNRTLITIRDDGRGIALDKIVAKAEQMGLDPTLLAAATDQELLSLIFEPGFSTTDKVTALSGRGVGMDVVRDNLKQVRGEITVDTLPGLGTTFTISIPFTISVVRVLLAESNGLLLALPTDIVEEIILLKSEQIITTADSEVLNWQGNLVSLIRLSQWLQYNCPSHPHALETPPTINSPSVLLVTQNNQLVGLQVDRCWGEQEVAVRRVEGTLPLPSGFTNCTIMGDGRVVPLVNVPELLHWVASCERSPNEDRFTDSRPVLSQTTRFSPDNLKPSLAHHLSPTNPSTVLIVDDSINVRRFLALTLERAGYRVEQAKDGQDALEKLQGGLSVQAVICDIEMPRLDGFGFLAKVKSTREFDHLPIAMLTSRSGDKHRQLALSLGAAAYFSKPYNEQVLLQTLEQLVREAATV